MSRRTYKRPELELIAECIIREYDKNTDANGNLTGDINFVRMHADVYPVPCQRTVGALKSQVGRMLRSARNIVHLSDFGKNPSNEYRRHNLRREVMYDNGYFRISTSHKNYRNRLDSANRRTSPIMVFVASGSSYGEVGGRGKRTGSVLPNTANIKGAIKTIHRTPLAKVIADATGVKKKTRKKTVAPITIARINWKTNIGILRSVLSIPQMISSINHYRMFVMDAEPVKYGTLKRYLSGGKDYTDTNVSYVEDWAERLRRFALGKKKKGKK